ncbi:ScbA/BarX family gamma-butyrolactone biosynthesis protein [Streptomyces sp. NPDC092370]|uniref:ScbA/BarX family gamma-butyrolactone biosynthesis protein n=1 Tax=Streptomyces sp. NPDC092370 TaxID=3366016 RepID=UPI0038092EA2
MVIAGDALSFLQPVTRELVHRSSIGEVFITDGLRVEENTFVVAAQWPRDHALYHPDENRLSDPLLLAETLRQGMGYVAHRYCGFRLGTAFVVRELDFEITDKGPLRVEHVPLSVVLEGVWAWDGAGPRGRAGARMDFRLTVNGRPCGRGSASMLMLDERRYRLLRRLTEAVSPGDGGTGCGGTRRVPPHRVGRLRWRDCVLEQGDSPDDWLLHVDRGHAVLFDHPTDHIPLMVMLEGFRQLGHLTVHEAHDEPFADLSFALSGATVQCHAFGEFHRPTRLVIEERVPGATPQEAFRLRLAAVQDDTVLARAETTWACVGTRAATAALAAW